MTYKFIFFALYAVCSFSFMNARAFASPLKPMTHDVAVPKIEFVDKNSDKYSTVKFMFISEMLEAYKIAFVVTEHEQDLQQVLHQELPEIKLLVDCVRQVNVYMMSSNCSEDDRDFFYTLNVVHAIRLFLLSYYGIIELSTDDEKVLYESIKNKTSSEICDILIAHPTYSEYCDKSNSLINRAYYFPACWEKQMRGVTISMWASKLKSRIRMLFSQNS